MRRTATAEPNTVESLSGPVIDWQNAVRRLRESRVDDNAEKWLAVWATLDSVADSVCDGTDGDTAELRKIRDAVEGAACELWAYAASLLQADAKRRTRTLRTSEDDPFPDASTDGGPGYEERANAAVEEELRQHFENPDIISTTGPTTKDHDLTKDRVVGSTVTLIGPGAAIADIIDDGPGIVLGVTKDHCVARFPLSGEVRALTWHEVMIDHVEPDPDHFVRQHVRLNGAGDKGGVK